ncbi:hypothetical protein FOMPIDRAFT_1026197 [Fomitopsis schrenkii]|uniref:DUF6534 domain-containing protein n=1 Tax=Fomitopsis schrenkii TaxID=2126942 RepID=S8EY04_FOMSC|nr:hypothetical protein FOMPIDRAFT_1026197 [Fomitopsis schrenkii]
MTGPNIHLDATVGCFFAGILLSVIFYGVTCAQTLFYVSEYSKDRWLMKGLVTLLFVLDTAITMADLDILWGYTVTNHSNPLALFALTDSFLVDYALSAVTVLLVQCWYMRNVWQFLSQRWYKIPLTAVCLMLALTSCACSLASVYLGNIDRTVPGIFVATKIPASLQTVSASVTDIYITVALTLVLRGERTGFKHTETLIRKLITYAINRGALTTALQIGQFLTYVSLPDTTFVWAIFHFVGCKAYVNSLLAILNARHYLQVRGGTGETTGGISAQEIALESLRGQRTQGHSFKQSRNSRPAPRHLPNQAIITLTTTTEVLGDDGIPVLESDKFHSEGRA